MSTARLRQDGGCPPSLSYGFEIDPCAVLGVTTCATLQDVRDAYRAKAKKHHPDQGGDEWAFRIVSRCYEILSTARVVSHAARDAGPAPRRRPEPAHPATGETEWLRPGVRDPLIDPVRMVDIEVFVIRFELEHPMDLLLLPPEDRSLCCCLNVTWSASPPDLQGRGHPDAPLALRLLDETFQAMPSKTHALGSWSHAEGDRFQGWLSYPTATRAWESFRAFHEALNGCGLGVNQWTREMVIPRDGRRSG
jgi:hypothetical protein